LQSVMRAIDNEEIPFDMSEALDGLSILDDSFIDKLESLPAFQTQSWSFPQVPNDIQNGGHLSVQAPTGKADDPALWQSLLLEQKKQYDAEMGRLRGELGMLRMNAKQDGKVVDGRPPFERDRWARVHQILDSYFNVVNERF